MLDEALRELCVFRNLKKENGRAKRPNSASTEGEERLLLPFRHLCPRLPVLAEICRAARGALGLDADPAADGGSGLALACV